MRTSLQTRLLVAVGLVAITAVVVVALAARQGARRESYRTDEARERWLGGAGLGLAIVTHLAEAQGGGAWARSTPTNGMAVGFSLPRPSSTRWTA